MILKEYEKNIADEIKDGVDRASLADIDTQAQVDIVERDVYMFAVDCMDGETRSTAFENMRQAISNAFYLGFSRGYKYGYRMGNGEINLIPLKYEPKEITQNEAGDIGV